MSREPDCQSRGPGTGAVSREPDCQSRGPGTGAVSREPDCQSKGPRFESTWAWASFGNFFQSMLSVSFG